MSYEISDADLMAEKLGIITLCEHCGKRVDESSGGWFHHDTGAMCCSNTGVQTGPNSWTFRFVPGKPRQRT